MTPEFNSSDFAYYAPGKVFSSDISDLGLKAFPREFYIVSKKTGHKALFKYMSRHSDNEGELMYVSYYCHELNILASLVND